MRRENGSLTVIAGPMFSNKTGELIRLATAHQASGRRVAFFKHSLDDRYGGGSASLSTHGGASVPARAVSGSAALGALSEGAQVVAIDEAQFFDPGLPKLARRLADRGATVIVAGLDLDFKGEPFGPMPELMAGANAVIRLRGICARCGSPEGTMTQRLIDGKPASRHGPVVLVGAAETYETRCSPCHRLGG